MAIQRVDPKGCGCTDCLTGYSKPLDQVGHGSLRRLLDGTVYNATGIDLDDIKRRAQASVMSFIADELIAHGASRYQAEILKEEVD